MVAKPWALQKSDLSFLDLTGAMLRPWLQRISGLSVGLLLAGCSTVRLPQQPVVIKILRTINNADAVTSKDYQRLRQISDGLIDQLKGIDPTLRPQLSLTATSKFIDEVAQQTRSGFGPDLIITDSETALGLYQRGLTDPIALSSDDAVDIPPSLLNLARATDGKLVGRPVNQVIQLACFNKDRIATSPATLADLEAASDHANYGFALQLKDLFWSAEAFNASEAMEVALDDRSPTPEQQEQMTSWLRWLKSASYQQNIRFLNNQGNLRRALVKGELDWITCWSSSLPELREQLKGRLGTASLPQGPAGTVRPTTRLQIWALGRNSSAAQRTKALAILDFVSKPWAQKTYTLQSRTSIPVNQKAATIVASKIPGGLRTVELLQKMSKSDAGSRDHAKARVFRDPSRYEAVSNALMDTIYDIHSPATATQTILKTLSDSR